MQSMTPTFRYDRKKILLPIVSFKSENITNQLKITWDGRKYIDRIKGQVAQHFSEVLEKIESTQKSN